MSKQIQGVRGSVQSKNHHMSCKAYRIKMLQMIIIKGNFMKLAKNY